MHASDDQIDLNKNNELEGHGPRWKDGSNRKVSLCIVCAHSNATPSMHADLNMYRILRKREHQSIVQVVVDSPRIVQGALDVHHLSVVGKDNIGGTPVAFEYSGTGSSSSLYPFDAWGIENLLDYRAIFGVG